MQFVDLKAQYAKLKNEIDGRIHRVLDHGQYIMGPEVSELEERLADFIGVSHCIAVASGTDALLIAMMALGVKAGDEVITTPFSFIATAETIALLGAKPVFVDIDPGTYNIDPDLIENAITDRTRALLPVSLYGQCADFDRINAMADKHGLPVIEDAAQSFGATYKGSKSCALSTIGCTSFFPSKPLGCYGDGGACFTSDDDLAKRMRNIRIHGQDRRYHHSVIGLNGRLDTIQAAVLLAKLDVFPDEIQSRGRVATGYDALLGEHCPEITSPYIVSSNSSVYAQYTIQVEQRDVVQRTLKDIEVPTAVHYPLPLHLQPAFASLGSQTTVAPHAERCAERVISLPMHPYLEYEAQRRVVQALAGSFVQ